MIKRLFSISFRGIHFPSILFVEQLMILRELLAAHFMYVYEHTLAHPIKITLTMFFNSLSFSLSSSSFTFLSSLFSQPPSVVLSPISSLGSFFFVFPPHTKTTSFASKEGERKWVWEMRKVWESTRREMGTRLRNIGMPVYENEREMLRERERVARCASDWSEVEHPTQ